MPAIRRWDRCTVRGTAERIETGNAGDAFSPQVAVDAKGNATAVWYQFDGTRLGIWSNRFDEMSGWGTAERIEDNTVEQGSPQVAVDANGNATAVWSQDNAGGDSDIWSNRFD